MPSFYRLRVLCLDTSLTSTGYTVLLIDPDSFKFKLAEFDVIDSSETEVGVETDARCRLLLSKVSLLIHNHNINCVVEECPGQSIYGQKFMSKNGIIGRAAKISKVTSAVHAILGYCYASGIYIKLVEPSQWQRRRNGKTNIKVWSVKEANRILEYLGSTRKLSAKEDHTADSINIAIHAVTKFRAKEWAVPTLTENVA